MCKFKDTRIGNLAEVKDCDVAKPMLPGYSVPPVVAAVAVVAGMAVMTLVAVDFATTCMWGKMSSSVAPGAFFRLQWE